MNDAPHVPPQIQDVRSSLVRNIGHLTTDRYTDRAAWDQIFLESFGRAPEGPDDPLWDKLLSCKEGRALALVNTL